MRAGVVRAVLVLILAVLALPSAALAAEGSLIGVRPADPAESWILLRLAPGESTRVPAVVVNLSGSNQRVALGTADGITTADGAFTLASEGEEPTGVGAWAEAGADVLDLAPREQRTVAVRVAVPGDATPGDHVGGLVVRPAAPVARQEGDGVAIEVVERVGLRIYVTVTGRRDPAVAVAGLSARASGGGALRRALGLPSAIDARFTARNTGNVAHERLLAQVELLDDGAVAASERVMIGTLLPGDARPVAVRLDRPGLAPADYTLRVRLMGAAPAEAAAGVAVGPWRAVAWAAGLAAALVLLVVLWRGPRRPLMRAAGAGALVLAVAAAGHPAPSVAAGAGLALHVQAGGLSAEAPAAVRLPTARPGPEGVTVRAPVGIVTVVDARGGARGWTLVARAEPLRDALGRPLAADVVVEPGPVTGGLEAGAAGPADVPRVLVAAPAGAGAGTSRLEPQVVVTVPAGARSGRYTGVLELTVA